MRKIAALLTTFVVLASLAVVLAATDATAAPCAKLCKPSIAACRAQGFTRRSCKRALVAACKSFYPHDCAFTVDGNGNVSQCPTDYTDCGPGNGCCASDTPFCTSDGKCSQVPDTTTTTTVTTSTTTTWLPPTTTTTLPAGPDYSVYSGSWGYAVNFQNYVGCPTYYPTQFSGTLQLSVSPGGSIVGSVDGAVAIAGSFTSYSSASVSSQAYSDAWGCATTFDADVTSFTTTQGVLELYLYQQCPGGPVCADYYVGAVAR